MGLKNAVYKDSVGRNYLVLLPEGVPDDEAERGIPLGPPSLEGLGLPEEVEVRLHNELFARGIIKANDAIRNRPEILGAIRAAFKVDVDSVLAIFVGKDFQNHGRSEPSESVPNPSVSNRRPS